MNCKYAVGIFSLLTLFLGIASGKKCYAAEFSEDVLPCPDFDNQKMICDSLTLGMVEGKAELGLNGVIDLTEPIEEGMEMTVEIWKDTEIGKEFMWCTTDDLCERLNDTNTAYRPMMDSMKINKCPIPMNKYSVKNMVVDLSHLEGVMTRQLCGEYKSRMSMKYITSVTELFSCYEVAVIITEHDC